MHLKRTVSERNVQIISNLNFTPLFKSYNFDTKKVTPFLKLKIRCGTMTFYGFVGFNCGKECRHIEEIGFSDHGKNILDPV